MIYASNALYSFIPKNGCSTLRLSVDSVDDFNGIHSNNATFQSSLSEATLANYTFVVLCCVVLMPDLLKGNTLSAVDPYSICKRIDNFNRLDSNQYVRISEGFERFLAFDNLDLVLTEFNTLRNRKVPGVDVFKFNNLTLFGHGMLSLRHEQVLISDSLHVWPGRSNSQINALIYKYDEKVKKGHP